MNIQPCTASDRPKTLIACVGNMLLLDEGFGPYMARVLTERTVAGLYFDHAVSDFSLILVLQLENKQNSI